jgi:hypothetical protein
LAGFFVPSRSRRAPEARQGIPPLQTVANGIDEASRKPRRFSFCYWRKKGGSMTLDDATNCRCENFRTSLV